MCRSFTVGLVGKNSCCVGFVIIRCTYSSDKPTALFCASHSCVSQYASANRVQHNCSVGGNIVLRSLQSLSTPKIYLIEVESKSASNQYHSIAIVSACCQNDISNITQTRAFPKGVKDEKFAVMEKAQYPVWLLMTREVTTKCFWQYQ